MEKEKYEKINSILLVILPCIFVMHWVKLVSISVKNVELTTKIWHGLS